MFAEAQLKDAVQRIDHVLARLLAGATLAVGARNLRDRRDNPAVLVRLEHDRQQQRFAHAYTVPRSGPAAKGRRPRGRLLLVAPGDNARLLEEGVGGWRRQIADVPFGHQSVDQESGQCRANSPQDRAGLVGS